MGGVCIGVGICIGIGVGGLTLPFLLIPALPCPILGLDIAGLITVGSLLSVGSVTTDFCLSSFTCGFTPLSMLCLHQIFVCFYFGSFCHVI